jgi:hypothetical protein
MDEQGSVLAQCMGSLLALYSSDTVCEQVKIIIKTIIERCEDLVYTG